MSKAAQLIEEDGKYFAKSGRIKYYPLVMIMVMVQRLSMLTVNHILIYYRVPVRKMLVMHLKSIRCYKSAGR